MQSYLMLMISTSILLIFFKMKTKKILILLYLELTMMWMITIMVYMNSKMLKNNMSGMIILMIFMVTESIFGISIMISSSRNSSKFNSSSISWF